MIYNNSVCGRGSAALRRLPWRAVTASLLVGSALDPFAATGAALAQAPGTDLTAQSLAENDGIASDILVTARRREESLQRTPVSATVLSGEAAAAQNIRNFQDLRGAVSNLEVLPAATGGASFTIRGIGQTSSQVNVDAKAGFYIDEMYVARQEGNQLYFYDVGSLQVLKGPQGTLFGKNTTAGAVLLTTRRPTDQANDSYVLVRAGSYRRLDTEGGINLPISDSLLSRISWRTQNADGYIDHVLDDGDSNNVNDRSVRAQLRYVPDDKLTVDFLGEVNRQDSDGQTSIMTGCRNNASYVRNYNATHSVALCNSYPVLNDPYKVYGGATLLAPTSAAVTDLYRGGDANNRSVQRYNGKSSFTDTKVGTLNLRANYEFTDWLALRSITAWRRSDSSWYNPTLNAPNDIYAEYDRTRTTQFTQELNVGGQAFDDRFTYVGGLYYFNQKTSFLQDTGPDWIDPLGYIYDADNKFESFAAYAQASFKVIPEIELTLGGRYSYDKKNASSYVFYAGRQNSYTYNGTVRSCGFFLGDFLGGLANCGGAPFTGAGSDTWRSFDPKAQISFQVTPALFLYGSWSKGYNAGGFNQQLGTNLGGRLVSYDPEKLTSWEAGFKSEWFERRLRLNVSAFFQDYKDIQTTLLINFNGIDTRQVQTGATAEEKGIEAEIFVQPFRNFTLQANGAYLDQKYTSVRPGVSFTTDTPVNSAPKYSYSIAGSYTVEFANDMALTASLNWRAVGKKAACNPIGSCYTPGYGILGGRLDLSFGTDSPWSAGLIATNLTDNVYEISRNRGGSMGIDSYVPGRPFEAAIEVTRKF